MINQLQNRPQSRTYKSQLQRACPITRSGDQQLAQKCFQMGKQHHQRNDLEKAEKFYIQATIHNPAHFKSYCNLGLCFKLRGSYPNSIQAYKRSLAINPVDPITHYNLANVYRLIGNYQRSIQHYRFVIDLRQQKAVDVKNLYSDSYNNLGICYKNIGNYDKAIDCFQKIIKQIPSDSSVKFNLSVSYLRLVRKMAKSLKSEKHVMLFKSTLHKTKNLFEEVLKLLPSNDFAVLALIELKCLQNQQQNNLRNCLSQIETLLSKPQLQLFTKDEASKIKAYCLNLLTQYQESIQEYQRILQRKKDEEEAKLAEEVQKKKTIEMKQPALKQSLTQKTKEKDKIIINETKQKPIVKDPQKKVENTAVTQGLIKKQKTTFLQNDIKKAYSSALAYLLHEINGLFLQINDKQNPQKFLYKMNDKQDPQQFLYKMNDKQDPQQFLYKTIEQSLIKNTQQILKSQEKSQIIQRIRRQLVIIGLSILGEKLTDQKYLLQAHETYLNYFLQGKIQTPVSKDTIFLETHRAVASILTNLGYSKKAIQHYEIISQALDEFSIKDADPLQQLHSGLAINYESQGLHEKAIHEFEQAIRLNPNNYILYYNLGYCQHCAGHNEEAILSYTKFLSQVEQNKQIDQQSKKSYILQALISMFVCEQGPVKKKLERCQKVQQKIQNLSNGSLQDLLKLVDTSTLIYYYLSACDLYEKIVFQQLKTSTPQSKQNKERLFDVYVTLLEFPNCPDRDQILINCGNILFEEKQFLNALQFYQKVRKSKSEVFNLIGLSLMNINEHMKALNCIEFAIECDRENKIYEMNYQIMKWAYGLNSNKNFNLLAQTYQCRCDTQFQTRVEFAKDLINKLTAYIELQIENNPSKTSPNLIFADISLPALFQALLSKQNSKTLLKSPEAFRKHEVLRALLEEHCQKVHNSNQFQFGKIKIKEFLETIVKSIEQPEKLKNKFAGLMSELRDEKLVNCPDYLNVLEQILSAFIYANTADKTHQQLLCSILLSQKSITPCFQIAFTDLIATPAEKYPFKSFKVVYPALELKLQNIILTYLSWQIQQEDQFVYLWKLIETFAYKNQLSQPVFIEYNFPYCKDLQSCQKCIKKAYFLIGNLLNIDCKQKYMYDCLKSHEEHKKLMYSKFCKSFGKNLESRLTPIQGQQKSITFALNDQLLSLQLEIHFKSESSFKKFLTQLCTELSAQQPKYQSQSQKLYLIINKLIRVKCVWNQVSLAEQFIQNIIKSPLTLRQCAIEFLDSQLLKNWAQDEILGPILSKIYPQKPFDL